MEAKIIKGVISVDPKIVGGEPVFIGTRVYIKTFFDYLEQGRTLEEFLKHFSTVTKEQAKRVLEIAKKTIISPDFSNKSYI